MIYIGEQGQDVIRSPNLQWANATSTRKNSYPNRTIIECGSHLPYFLFCLPHGIGLMAFVIFFFK